MTENEIGQILVDSAVNLHMKIGPGLLESVYEAILMRVLLDRNLKVQRQVPIPIYFENLKFEEGFRADLIIENKVVVELKSVEIIKPVHKKQLLTYMRFSNMKLGFLLNFGAPVMKQGISRIIDGSL